VSLPPLATVDDVQQRMFRDITDAEAQRVEVMLDDASAVVRGFCRQNFTQVRATQRIRPVGYRIRLPQRPVVAVHSVALLINNRPITVAGYTWDGTDEVWLGDMGRIINLAETASEWLATHTPVAEVDYTSGYTESPPGVVSVVCSMLTRTLSAPGAGGIISEAVGEYTYRLSDAAAQGPLTLTDAEKAILAAYRRPGAAVELRW
jgi:hypothetical protein